MPYQLAGNTAHATPIETLDASVFAAWNKKLSKRHQAIVEASGFTGKPGSFLLLPGDTGKTDKVILGLDKNPGIWSFAALPAKLPAGAYRIEGKFSAEQLSEFALGWLLGCYEFTRYKKSSRKFAHLVAPKGVNAKEIEAQAVAITMVRDLINTPTNDMLPSHLAEAASTLAKKYKAECKVIVGDALLKNNYPTIHMVGRASSDAPRLIDIRWGKPLHPKVTLVGKGVCFDSGGLDIKPSSGMRLMKKDMGGAANVLGLAQMIMDAKLPVRLRVLIPAVENAISANAFRPGDIVKTRAGLTVEIDNTDAEGRLILCDALAEADSEAPEILIDCATLTGAARVATGTDLPACFTNNDALYNDLFKASEECQDPLWRLPLWEGYRPMLDSQIADMVNSASSGYAGAITAALFLKEFVKKSKAWVHLDMMAWNMTSRPGRPAGGEAQSIRALYDLIKNKYK